MNIDDVADPAPSDRPWRDIFRKQRELMDKYHEIESKNGANHPAPPWNIDDKFVQWRIKDGFWRFTEEMAEAWEARREYQDKLTGRYSNSGSWAAMISWRETQKNEPLVRHFLEELIDALHFIVEASIFANMEDILISQLEEKYEVFIETGVGGGESEYCVSSAETSFHGCIMFFGLAANFLKNKPWKQTQMVTDLARFQLAMKTAWFCYVDMFLALRLGQDDLYKMYFKKHLVNQFRQKSNY